MFTKKQNLRRKRSRQFAFLPVLLISLILLAFFIQPTVAEIRANPNPEQQVARAWELAQQSGAYRFRTQVEQTTFPAPMLSNVGRTSTRERFDLQGRIDQPQDLLELSLWPNGRRAMDVQDGAAGGPLDIRVESGRAYSRSDGDEWQEIDNVADLFAPGGDPLGIMAGAKNIRLVEVETREIPGAPALQFAHYSYEMNGPAFAAYMRDQLERHLQEQGELPPNLDLETPAIYEQSTGQGDIWLDEQGLPYRLTTHLDFPRQANGERVSVEFTSDFFDFDQTRLAQSTVKPWQDPVAWVNHRLPSTPAEKRDLGLGISSWMFIGAVGLVGVANWRDRRFYTIVALLVIASMVSTPLVRAAGVARFNQSQQTRRAESEAREAKAEASDRVQASLRGEQWNPNQSLLETTTEDLQPASSMPNSTRAVLAATDHHEGPRRHEQSQKRLSHCIPPPGRGSSLPR